MQERQVIDIKCRLPQTAAKRDAVPRDYVQDQKGVYAVRRLASLHTHR